MTLSTDEPRVQSAISSAVVALRRIAGYELDAALARQLQELSEQKEFLDQPRHDELMALVAFAQQRTIDKLEAQVALRRLHELMPDVVQHP
jgi:hypothetical protein